MYLKRYYQDGVVRINDIGEDAIIHRHKCEIVNSENVVIHEVYYNGAHTVLITDGCGNIIQKVSL